MSCFTMRYRPAEELRKLFLPILAAERVISYCGGGIASSSDAFILHLLGHQNVADYDGGSSSGRSGSNGGSLIA